MAPSGEGASSGKGTPVGRTRTGILGLVGEGTPYAGGSPVGRAIQLVVTGILTKI